MEFSIFTVSFYGTVNPDQADLLTGVDVRVEMTSCPPIKTVVLVSLSLISA